MQSHARSIPWGSLSKLIFPQNQIYQQGQAAFSLAGPIMRAGYYKSIRVSLDFTEDFLWSKWNNANVGSLPAQTDSLGGLANSSIKTITYRRCTFGTRIGHLSLSLGLTHPLSLSLSGFPCRGETPWKQTMQIVWKSVTLENNLGIKQIHEVFKLKA